MCLLRGCQLFTLECCLNFPSMLEPVLTTYWSEVLQLTEQGVGRLTTASW